VNPYLHSDIYGNKLNTSTTSSSTANDITTHATDNGNRKFGPNGVSGNNKNVSTGVNSFPSTGTATPYKSGTSGNSSY